MSNVKGVMEQFYNEISSGESITTEMGKKIEEEKKKMLEEYKEYLKKQKRG